MTAVDLTEAIKAAARSWHLVTWESLTFTEQQMVLADAAPLVQAAAPALLGAIPVEALLNLEGIWDPSCPPGGMVCPLCGDPWESEPACPHALAVRAHDQRVREHAARCIEESVSWLASDDEVLEARRFADIVRGAK